MNVKPVELRTGHTSNEETEARKEVEKSIKGNKKITKTPPKDKSTDGKKLYKEIILLLPKDFLSAADVHTVNNK